MRTTTPIDTTHVDASQAPAPSRGGLKKVQFGALKPKAKEEKTAYPVLPDPNGAAAEIAARILERTEQFDVLKGALETDKAELKLLTLPYYFEVNTGRHEVPSSVSVNSPKGEVLVTFQNRYSMLPDEAAVESILGDNTEKFFRQSFEIKIKSDKLPEAKTQDFVDELQALAVKYGCTEALEVRSGVLPTKEFHAARHLTLTPQQNVELDQACPVIAMVKTKGRK